MVHIYEFEVRELADRVLNASLPFPRTVFYGSSSIRLWPSLGDDFPGTPIVNLGFGGSTLEACAHWFEALVPPAHPRSILLYAGDNDLGDGRSPEQVHASYLALREKSARLLPGVPICFLSIKPSPLRWALADRMRRANALIAASAESLGPAGFLDVFDEMLDERGEPRTELYEGDQLHLSPAGYRLWADFLKRSPAAHIMFS
jgi:lysophospholipase L1-like esterase